MQKKEKRREEIFQIEHPNFIESPFTGMTRQHWKDAAFYLLKGAFSHIKKLDDPMKFPFQKGKSYPHNISQIPTEKLEGLCRTLMMASPLLKENPDMEIDGIKVSKYYVHQICELIDPKSQSYIKPRGANEGPSQNLVEFSALAISLFIIPEILWAPLSHSQKDNLARIMISYGEGPTVPSNWKFFNIFILSFYKTQGYQINEDLLVYYLNKTLEHYIGDGWYNDNPSYDYYSMWAFQTYGILWIEFFGNRYYPELAKQFLNNFNEQVNYPFMFSRAGEMIMWGRSISYRFGAAAVFPLMGFINNTDTNYGWIRRIASGTMLQFLQQPKFLKDGVPTLGFYGPFEPAVQNYNCRGSVYWCGKIFLGLLVPKDNPFWTATENEGPWKDDFAKDAVYSKYSPHTNILLTNYPGIGASEIRAWCHIPVIYPNQPFRGHLCYINLSYNTAFPWQAQGPNGEVTMNYVLKNQYDKWEPLHVYTFKKFENEVYYRDAVMETNKNIVFQLADVPLLNGILRIDRLSCLDNTNKFQPFEIRLGHYALPQYKNKIKEEAFDLESTHIKSIDNGIYKLAMIPIAGFEETEIVHCVGINPSSLHSKVINAKDKFDSHKNNTKYYITLEIWKYSGSDWNKSELKPFRSIEIVENKKSVEIIFNDNLKKIINF
jgi:hypothetical protein